jgi:ribosome-associated toxin RatA of RatAB toxin-antitoxin module
MPDVELDMEIRAPVERVWEAVVDIEHYPDSMANVRWVKIVEEQSAEVRRAAWSVTLKGSILQWEEEEHLDHHAHTIEFDQVRGDMDIFEGSWALEEREPGLTHVRLTVTFEIGIPLLADMLNPVAQLSLRENCAEMLLGVEREALGARG